MEDLSLILSIIASIFVICGGATYIIKNNNKNSKNSKNKISNSKNVIIGDENNGEKFKK